MKISFRGAAMLLIFVGLSATVFAVWQPFKTRRDEKLRSMCQSSLKQMGLGTMQYVRDYDEHFMLSHNWWEAMYPYMRANLSCPNFKVGYLYNRNLNAINDSVVENSQKILLFYEAPGDFGSDKGERWPSAGVHGAGVNVAFTDGHVKWMQKKPKFFEADWPEQMRRMKAQEKVYWEKEKREEARREIEMEKWYRKSGQKPKP